MSSEEHSPGEDLSGHFMGWDNYLESKIGSGGMTDVYRARRGGSSVAVKVLRTIEDPQVDREVKNRLRVEAGIIESLDHPNIVRVLDYVAENGRSALVMPLVEGGDLDDLLKESPPPGVGLELLAQIADALAYLASKSVVHRDLKPSNILICRDAAGITPLVTDFGIGAALNESYLTGHLTWGTALYTAPELSRGEHALPPCDVYSLGITAYQVLTGSLPAFDAGPPPRPDGMPAALWSLLLTMLDLDPARRPGADEVATRMRQSIASVGGLSQFSVAHLQSGATSLAEARAADTESGPVRAPGSLSIARRLRSSIWLAVCLFVGLAAFVAVVLVLLVDRRPADKVTGNTSAGYNTLGPVVFSDNFSREDASTWGPAWGPGITPTAGSNSGASIVDSEGVLAAGDAGNYDPKSQISRRIEEVSLDDLDVEFQFRALSSDASLWLVGRTDARVDANTGYQLVISPGDGVYFVEARRDYKSVHLGTLERVTENLAFERGVMYRARFQIVGGRVRARVWPSVAPEPTSWGVDGAASESFSGRAVGFSVGAGLERGLAAFAIDDVVVRRARATS